MASQPLKLKKMKKPASNATPAGKSRQIAAGEFKAKCLAIIDEVHETRQEVIITKRGKPMAKVIPFEAPTVDSLFGRLRGIVRIVGNPDDLIKPAFDLEDWDMLK